MTKDEILKRPHPDWPLGSRGALEYALRDAYAAGCSAGRSMSLLTAMEYAEREALRIAELLADES